MKVHLSLEPRQIIVHLENLFGQGLATRESLKMIKLITLCNISYFSLETTFKKKRFCNTFTERFV